MCSPALAALASQPDRFRLTLLTMFPSVAAYLREQGFTDDVRFVDFLSGTKLNAFRRIFGLRSERFDVSVVAYPHNRIQYNTVARIIGARTRIGFRYQRQRLMNLPWLNNVVIEEDPNLHVVQENIRWASMLTGIKDGAIPDDMLFRTSAETEKQAEAFWRSHGLHDGETVIGVHPSCNGLKNQQNRCWPPDQFVEAIRRLSARQPDLRFVVFEGPQDAQIAGKVQAAGANVVAARQLPVTVVGAVIRRCRLFLSNCSGLIHIAAACKVPVVGIYGPTNPVWDGPWKTRSVVVNRGLPCSPCFYYSSRPLSCPAGLDYACVREMPVDNVEAAVTKLLQEDVATRTDNANHEN